MKKTLKRAFSAALALAVALALVLPALAAQENDIIKIKSVDDLISLSEKCSLDTWSQGKTVRLESDIELLGSDFLPIPTFGGTFDGQGHTVSGLTVTGSVSIVGFFCYVQSGAVVKNLKVEGRLTPYGTQRSIGGIAGENSGKLINCSFSGVISGDSSVGGVVGINELSGEMYGCAFEGRVTGEHYTGGVAGQSFGTLSSCTNFGSINTIVADPKYGLEEVQSVQDYLQSSDESDLVNTSTDTGGVVGYSTGVILSCKNKGIVGYPHIGYNVGGIVGRSDGYINACVNSGEVMGRKDVGGVAGQMEPDIIMTFSGDSLTQLEAELDKLHDLINSALDDADASTAAISTRMTNISGYASTARDSAHDMTDIAGTFIDNNIAEIDRGSAILADTLDRLSPIVSQLEDLSPLISDGLEKTQTALEQLSSATESGTKAIAHMSDCVSDIKLANDRLEAASGELSDGIARLQDTVVVEDENAVSQALDDIASASGDMSAALADMSTALNDISSVLEGADSWEDIVARDEELIAALNSLADATAAASAAFSAISADLQTIAENVSFDSEAYNEGVELIKAAMDDLELAAGFFGDALDDLQLALEDLETASDRLDTALDTLASAVEVFRSAADSFSETVSDISDLVDYLASVDPIQLVQLGEDFSKSSDELYASLTGLSGQLDLLNSDMRNASTTLTSDVRAINDQFLIVTNLMLDAIYDARDTKIDDYYVDTSDEDIDSTTVGKALACENSGDVSGDVNVGGITGSVAIDYDFDPEDDFSESSSDYLNSRAETKAIIQRCTNRGAVTSKKDCAGAIVGLEDIGLVIDCRGFGSVQSTGGDYVGGIAGHALSTVRESWAKCTLSGGEFVGGIVGSGTNTKSCVSMVRIEDSTQFSGAVSGDVEGDFYENVFVSDELAGIDRVSYAGRAEPIEYKKLLEIEGLPDEFKKFTVTFTADGEPLSAVSMDYLSVLTEADLPEIPAVEGSYARWEPQMPLTISFDETVNIVYTPFETVLASGLERDGGLSVILVEGQFTDACTLETTDCASPPPKASESWHLSVTPDGQAAHFARLLPLDGEGKATVYVKTGGEWKSVKSESFGEYLRFEFSGDEADIAVSYGQSPKLIYIICGSAALLALVVLIAINATKRAKNRKKIARAPADPPSKKASKKERNDSNEGNGNS